MENLKVFKSILDIKLHDSDQVMIFPHKEADFDAISSSMGMSLISRELKKDNYIVFGDKQPSKDLGIQKIIDEEKSNFSLISQRSYRNIVTDNSLSVLCDVNKPKLVYGKKINPDRLVVIDHHQKDKESFDASLEYIDVQKSSTAEIITMLLDLYKVDISSNMANILLTGILLDTNKLSKNVSINTIKAVGSLLERGACMEIAQEYFIEDFKSDRKIHELINDTQFLDRIGLIKAKDDKEYTKEELAKAADYLLKFKIDAAFVIGNLGKGITAVSARSKAKIDIAGIMQELSGGGTPHSGATKLKRTTIDEVEKRLMKVLAPRNLVNVSK